MITSARLTTLSLETVSEPEFVNITRDTVNYNTDPVVKKVNEVDNGVIITKMPSVIPACDPQRPDFCLEPPQLELNPEMQEETCCKVYRGGDLFDDIKKMRTSWRMIK